jgi:hypothetical protein
MSGPKKRKKSFKDALFSNQTCVEHLKKRKKKRPKTKLIYTLVQRSCDYFRLIGLYEREEWAEEDAKLNGSSFHVEPILFLMEEL